MVRKRSKKQGDFWNQNARYRTLELAHHHTVLSIVLHLLLVKVFDLEAFFVSGVVEAHPHFLETRWG